MDDVFKVQDKALHLGAISDSTSEHFIDGSFGEFGELQKIPTDFIRRTISLKKMYFLVAFLGVAGVIILSRLIYLQLWNGAYYRNLAEGNRARTQIVRAARGIIYDRNGWQLVKNVPNFVLSVIPAYLPKKDEERKKIVSTLASVLNLPENEIHSALNEFSKDFSQPVPIRENLEYTQAILFKIKSSAFPGVILEVDTRRQYVAAAGLEENKSESTLGISSLSHILGYEGRITKEEYNELKSADYTRVDRVGKTGIESAAEKFLRGRQGKTTTEVDALGREKNILSSEAPKDGDNITLTIDTAAQLYLENALLQGIKNAKAARGAAVVLAPHSGEILALVSIPAYANNDFARGIKRDGYLALLQNKNKPLFSRALSGEYPSGSTIKPVIAAAALEEDVINANTTFVSVGGIRIGQWFFPDWKEGGHGPTNVIKALAESVNTFFYMIGGGGDAFAGLGPERIARYLKRFGIGERLGIDMPGETTGFLPTEEWKQAQKNEPWYIGDTYHLSIGQGDLLVTPLQVAAWTSVFASGGNLFVPHIIKEVVNQNGEKSFAIPKLKEQSVVSQSAIATVNRGLREAVLKGSARALQSVPVPVAGKTGTAQWKTNSQPHAWFTGFAPFDKPEIVVTVLIEEGGEGSAAAVPVAKDFLNWYFSRP